MATLKRPKILYERGTVSKLSKQFGLSKTAIRNALNFVSEYGMSDAVRKAAIEDYGAVLVQRPIKQ